MIDTAKSWIKDDGDSKRNQELVQCSSSSRSEDHSSGK
jgi:hypothetical protein